LSDLQTKAEAEISKAQKLISEKDAELHAAEGSLSGLEEVLRITCYLDLFGFFMCVCVCVQLQCSVYDFFLEYGKADSQVP
jgi:hypothetical protein